MRDKYRIEEMGEQPEELRGVISELGLEFCIVRNHDDELISVYGSREEAEHALIEVNKPEQGEVK